MTGNEQDPPFDPAAAAAEPFLGEPVPTEYLPTAEEDAAAEAMYAQEKTVAETLARHGVDLDMAEDQSFIEELAEVNDLVKTLRHQWDALAARQIADDIQPEDESRYDQISEELSKVHERGELVAMASYLATCTGSDNSGYNRESLLTTLVAIAATPLLTAAQKKTYLDAAEELIGQERFSEAMAGIGRGNLLEQELGRLAAEEGNVSTAAHQLQDIQAFLVEKLGVSNIQDEEWLSFANDLRRTAYFQRIESNEPRIQRMFHKINVAAARLAISPETLATLFARLGIERG